MQLGNYANHVGSHFWNFQESSFVFAVDGGGDSKLPDVDHDVLFREGETLGGEMTFTPRLVAVDLKGSLGLLPALGDLYERPTTPRTDSISWGGLTQLRKEEPGRKSDFMRELEAAETGTENKDRCEIAGGRRSPELMSDLDEQVQYWSDYLRPRLHPRTNVLLREFKHRDSFAPFDVFGLGQEAFREGEGEEMEERIRGFAEEVDGLQGFQVTADAFDAFGGLASGVLQLLSDEYPGKCVLTFPVTPCHFGDNKPRSNSARFVTLTYIVRTCTCPCNTTLVDG